jgi:hypothetical protein
VLHLVVELAMEFDPRLRYRHEFPLIGVALLAPRLG